MSRSECQFRTNDPERMNAIERRNEGKKGLRTLCRFLGGLGDLGWKWVDIGGRGRGYPRSGDRVIGTSGDSEKQMVCHLTDTDDADFGHPQPRAAVSHGNRGIGLPQPTLIWDGLWRRSGYLSSLSSSSSSRPPLASRSRSAPSPAAPRCSPATLPSRSITT